MAPDLDLRPIASTWATARQRAQDLDLDALKARVRLTQVVAALWPYAVFWRSGPEYVTRCPWHADTHPSFCVHPRKQKAFCAPCGFAGDVFDVVMRERACSLTDAVAFVRNLGPARLRVWDAAEPLPRRAPPGTTTASSAAAEATEIYSYRDAQGQEQYQVLRLPGKRFRCRHWDAAAKRWVWNLDRRPLLYHGDLLARLAREDRLDWCLVCERERATDAAWSLGFPATTNHGGAGKWTREHSWPLLSLGIERVTILPDHDAAGEQHAAAVAESLKTTYSSYHGISSRVLRLPGLPPKGDLVDWIRAGGTARELLRLVGRVWA
jgi:hypothetical protein